MNAESREPAVAESYPTFWDAAPLAPISQVGHPEDAYTAFVNLTEDALPANTVPDDE